MSTERNQDIYLTLIIKICAFLIGTVIACYLVSHFFPAKL